MPHVPRMPPATRFFARLDRFSCECPACGKVIYTGRGITGGPRRLEAMYKLRPNAVANPRARNVWKLHWNPITQRLVCPYCTTPYTAGLVLYPLAKGYRRSLTPPPDTVPTPHQRAELRHLAGGYFGKEPRSTAEEEVNLVIDDPCTCSEVTGWTPSCPVHGHKPAPPIEYDGEEPA